jgi:hypothetical protein
MPVPEPGCSAQNDAGFRRRARATIGVWHATPSTRRLVGAKPALSGFVPVEVCE